MDLHFIPLIGNTRYLDMGYSCVGAYLLPSHDIVLIDSGFRPSPELFELLDQEQLRVEAVLCTHLHVDHVANNYALIERFGTKIYAGEREIKEATEGHWHVWPEGKEGEILPIPDGASSVTIQGVSFDCLPTPGHTLGHLSFASPDGVFFIGDAMVSPAVLKNSKLPYMTDIKLAEDSMRKIDQTSYPCYLAAHKGPMGKEALHACVDENLKKETDLLEELLSLLTEPMTITAAINQFLLSLQISKKHRENPEIYFTARQRLEVLAQDGKILIQDGYVYPILDAAHPENGSKGRPEGGMN